MALSSRRVVAVALVIAAVLIAVFNLPAEGPVLLTISTGRGVAVNDVVAAAIALVALCVWMTGRRQT
ncbi:MAG: hypothetical protein ACRDZ6_02735 [Acidimicrobiales bacterium]